RPIHVTAGATSGASSRSFARNAGAIDSSPVNHAVQVSRASPGVTTTRSPAPTAATTEAAIERTSSARIVFVTIRRLRLPSHCRRALAATGVLAVLLGGLYALAVYGLVPSILGDDQLAVSIAVVAAAVVAAVTDASWRRPIFVVAAGVAAAFVFGWWAIALGAYVAAIVGLGRAGLPIYAKLAIAFAGWLVLP